MIFKLGQVVSVEGRDEIFVVDEDVHSPSQTVVLTNWDRGHEHAGRESIHVELSKVSKRPLSYDQIVDVFDLMGYGRHELLKQFMKVNRPETIRDIILSSHEAVCASKEMDENEAFGHHPAVYYSLAMCGECGELANNIVKAMRNGPDKMEKMKEAISSELQDVIIYAYILAETNGIVVEDIVRNKVEVVIQRAKDGYYGKPLERKK